MNTACIRVSTSWEALVRLLHRFPAFASLRFLCAAVHVRWSLFLCALCCGFQFCVSPAFLCCLHCQPRGNSGQTALQHDASASSSSSSWRTRCRVDIASLAPPVAQMSLTTLHHPCSQSHLDRSLT